MLSRCHRVGLRGCCAVPQSSTYLNTPESPSCADSYSGPGGKTGARRQQECLCVASLPPLPRPLSSFHRFGNSQPKQRLKRPRGVEKLNADLTHRSERAHRLTTGCTASARWLQAFYGMMSSAFVSWGGDQFQRSPETPRRVGSRALASIKERLASLRGFRPRPALVSYLFRHQPSP